jgi:hypothetical protein
LGHLLLILEANDCYWWLFLDFSLALFQHDLRAIIRFV